MWALYIPRHREWNAQVRHFPNKPIKGTAVWKATSSPHGGRNRRNHGQKSDIDRQEDRFGIYKMMLTESFNSPLVKNQRNNTRPDKRNNNAKMLESTYIISAQNRNENWTKSPYLPCYGRSPWHSWNITEGYSFNDIKESTDADETVQREVQAETINVMNDQVVITTETNETFFVKKNQHSSTWLAIPKRPKCHYWFTWR